MSKKFVKLIALLMVATVAFCSLPMSALADNSAEAVGALMVLGYSRAEAEKAVSAVSAEGLSVEETVRRALKSIG